MSRFRRILLVLVIGILAVFLSLYLLSKFYMRAQSRQDEVLIDSFTAANAKRVGRVLFRNRRKPDSLIVSMETLQSLIPIRCLDKHILEHIHPKAESISATGVLFAKGDTDSNILYLLEGVVWIEMKGGQGYRIDSGAPEARFPLSTGPIHRYSAIARTDIRVLRVPNSMMKMGGPDSSRYGAFGELDGLVIPGELKLSGLVHTFCQQLANESLELPPFPDVACKLSEAINKDVGTTDAARIIQLDPTLVAKLIQIANSPFYLTGNPATRCQDAVNRIGLTATREIVTSVSLKQVFQCKQPRIKRYLSDLWASSVNLASLCYVLAMETRCVDPDQALLAGLTCDIGIVPFLVFAENFPEELFEWEELDQAVPYLRGPVGRRVLEQWKFPDEMTEIPALSEHWYYDSDDRPGLVDIVILAKLHGYIGTRKQSEVPPLNAVPAYAKFEDLELSPQKSLGLLHDAGQQVQSIRQFLNI